MQTNTVKQWRPIHYQYCLPSRRIPSSQTDPFLFAHEFLFPAQGMPHSVWRRVRARVHLSLTPTELSNPVRSATKKAFSSLLMRYSPELGGAVVAHIGPVELCGPPAFIDASPFAHVAAIATLLVFAPTKGTELLGVVTHVGPDHLGLSVLSGFHAVLPFDSLEDVYRFESRYTNIVSIHSWQRIDGPDHVTVNRQLRFIVSELKPTRTGLFQIIASLDPTLRQNPNDSHPLGLVPREKEIPLSTQPLQGSSDTAETGRVDVLHVTARTSTGRASDHLTGDELLRASNDMLGDALTPTPTPISLLKKKKRRRSGTEAHSVDFEDSKKEMQSKQRHRTSEQSRSENIPSQAVESNVANDVDKSGLKVTGKVKTSDQNSDRKKRKKDKKKKKQHSVSSDAKKRSEPNGVKSTKDGDEKEEIDSRLPVTDRQEETSTGNGDVGKDMKKSERKEQSSQKKEGKKSKKSKKKKREKDASRSKENLHRREESAAVVKTETKTEGTNKEDGVDVNRENSIRRDAEKAVELKPIKGEDKVVEKKKKKKRRSSDRETDEPRPKKKRKKRMSEAMEIERRRSLQQ